MPSEHQVDILAIAAHRDDVEQTCGGTLLTMQARGWRTGILDLTRGESGTRGTCPTATSRTPSKIASRSPPSCVACGPES
jgi:LmbE family N-acetylglucosaminyl deacetylase